MPERPSRRDPRHDEWAAADYEGRLELLTHWLAAEGTGGAMCAELVSLFAADSHEIAAKLMVLRSRGIATYDARHKWWSS